MLAALEQWLAPGSLSDEALLELLMLCKAPAFVGRKPRARLEALLALPDEPPAPPAVRGSPRADLRS
jgi:hypothetical protein